MSSIARLVAETRDELKARPILPFGPSVALGAVGVAEDDHDRDAIHPGARRQPLCLDAFRVRQGLFTGHLGPAPLEAGAGDPGGQYFGQV